MELAKKASGVGQDPDYQYQRGSESSRENNPVQDSGPSPEPVKGGDPVVGAEEKETEILNYVFQVW